MGRVLRGDYGWDLLFALNPVRRLAGGPGRSAPAKCEEIALRDLRLAIWGLNMCRTGGHRSPPPEAVFIDGDLWARNEATEAWSAKRRAERQAGRLKRDATAEPTAMRH